MNYKFKSLMMVLAFPLMFLVACDDYIPEPKSAEEVNDDDDDEIDDVSFAMHIVPIFENNCVGCHDGGPSPQLAGENVYNNLMDGYVVPAEPEESILYNKISDPSSNHYNRIPSDEERDKIKNWIKQGAEDN